jgi:hypothetical protein
MKLSERNDDSLTLPEQSFTLNDEPEDSNLFPSLGNVIKWDGKEYKDERIERKYE